MFHPRFRHKGPPAAEGGNFARAVDIGGFDDKTLDAAAVGEAYRADRQRRRHRGDELPNEAAESAQISSSIDDPAPALTRSMPGFGGAVASA